MLNSKLRILLILLKICKKTNNRCLKLLDEFHKIIMNYTQTWSRMVKTDLLFPNYSFIINVEKITHLYMKHLFILVMLMKY